MSDRGPVDYYLPDGQWTNFITGEVCADGRWMREETVDFFHRPLWVRENTMLPLGADETRPDYDYADGVTLRCYGLWDGADITLTIPDIHGAPSAIFQVICRRTQVDICRTHGDKPWRVEFAGKHPVMGSAVVDQQAVSQSTSTGC